MNVRGGPIVFNPRAANAITLLIEVAIIGGFSLSAALDARIATALTMLVIPFAWRILYASGLTVASQYMFPTPEATRLLSRPWLRLVATGGVAILRNQVGMAFPPRLQPLSTNDRAPILALIPGYGCNAGCFGTLPKRLAAHGLECVMIEASNAIGDLAENATEVVSWLNSTATRTPSRPIILVGVSMGGIVARLATVQPGAPQIAHLVTISSPHHGTWTARFGLGPAARQMRLDSVLLQRLRSKPHTCPATAIWTPDDTIILPPASGQMDGAEIVAVAGYTHLAIVEAPEVEAAIVRVTLPSTAVRQP